MNIENRVIRLPVRGREQWLDLVAGTLVREVEEDAYPLRYAITRIDDGVAWLELTLASGWREVLGSAERPPVLLPPRRKRYQTRPFAVVQVVPTGVRCEFGGDVRGATPPPAPSCW